MGEKEDYVFDWNSGEEAKRQRGLSNVLSYQDPMRERSDYSDDQNNLQMSPVINRQRASSFDIGGTILDNHCIRKNSIRLLPEVAIAEDEELEI